MWPKVQTLSVQFYCSCEFLFAIVSMIFRDPKICTWPCYTFSTSDNLALQGLKDDESVFEIKAQVPLDIARVVQWPILFWHFLHGDSNLILFQKRDLVAYVFEETSQRSAWEPMNQSLIVAGNFVYWIYITVQLVSYGLPLC